MTKSLHRAALGLACGLGLMAGAAQAVPIEITITNNQSSGGLYLTPLFTTFHDGTFDTFDVGSASSAELQALAEGGDASGLESLAAAASVQSAVITSPGGFPGAPVIDPGESASIVVDLDPMTERYLSFLSMVIPSNDAFIGNDNPLAYQIFNGSGDFTGLGPISILGGDVWDGGTEANTNLGAAFNAAGGPRTAEDGLVTVFGDLSGFLGETTAAGPSITSVPSSTGLLATIEVAPIPLPAGLPLLMGALGLLGVLRMRSA